MELDPAAAGDIYILTGGNPYEVNLVCHFIWDALRNGEHSGFELSPAVIEQVLDELAERGRHESSDAISVLSDLASTEYEALARIAPFEALTVRQIALHRLMLADYAVDQLEEEEAGVRADLAALEARRVLTIEADRFALSGGSDARLYAKYAVQREGGRAIKYGTSYAQRATFVCGDELGEALVGDKYNDALITGQRRPHEVGGLQTGRWMTMLCDAASEGALPSLAALLQFPISLEPVVAEREHGLVVTGLALQIGVEEAEHVEVMLNTADLTQDDADGIASDWVTRTAELLDKYSIRVLECRVEVLEPELARNLLAYSQLRVFGGLSFLLHSAGLVDQALDALAECVTQVEALLGGEVTDPLVRWELAEAYSRLAFMNATLEKFAEARELLQRSGDLAVGAQWLREYNEGYVLAREGRIDEAAVLAEQAVEHVSDEGYRVVLHADFGAPEDWVLEDARWNVVELNGSWIKRFVCLQAAVWRARSGDGDGEALLEQLDGLSRSAPVPVLRLAAWAELSVADRKDKAEELFARVIETAGLDDEARLRREAELALGRKLS